MSDEPRRMDAKARKVLRRIARQWRMSSAKFNLLQFCGGQPTAIRREPGVIIYEWPRASIRYDARRRSWELKRNTTTAQALGLALMPTPLDVAAAVTLLYGTGGPPAIDYRAAPIRVDAAPPPPKETA